jgi:hypothetical protein
MPEHIDAGPEVAPFPATPAMESPMNDHNDGPSNETAGPEVVQFRPAAVERGLNELLVGTGAVSGIVTSILGVAPGTATHAPTNQTVLTWCNDDG